MKQIKFLTLALTILMGISFTSCLDSDSGPYQWYRYVTVDSWMGIITLKGDDGFTYTPTNPNALQYQNSSEYVKRALVLLQLADENDDFVEGKTEYKVTIAWAGGIEVKEFCEQPDTINAKKIVQMSEYGAWAANDYVTVECVYACTYVNDPQAFDLYPEKAEGDVLTVRFCHSYGRGENAYSQASAIKSFRIPSVDRLNQQLDRVEGGTLVPANDSISVIVVAEGTNGELKSQKTKIKAPRY